MDLSPIADILEDQHDRIGEYLHASPKQWAHRVRLVRRLTQPRSGESTESAWTFLAACGYAMAGQAGVRMLAEALTGTDQETPALQKIWLEARPVSPRLSPGKREGQTSIDLALGTIAARGDSKSGIELGSESSPWICFCETKWLDDISPNVEHDPFLNQLLRVIENALCFQRRGVYAARAYVTLVTPGFLRNAPVRCRLYQYKFDEYCTDPARIRTELDAIVLNKNAKPGWSYPSDILERLPNLTLRWSTFDDLFALVPQSPVSKQLQTLWHQYGYGQKRSKL